jgi:hypothetical protein
LPFETTDRNGGIELLNIIKPEDPVAHVRRGLDAFESSLMVLTSNYYP